MPSQMDMTKAATKIERDLNWVAQIELIATKDQSALARFYDLTNRAAFGLILRILNDRSSAEEVLLDVYSQVWRQAVFYNSERGTPLAWLMTIARTRALDRLRSTKQELFRKEPLETAAEARSFEKNPEEFASANEQQRLVRNALAKLAPEQREVIELAYFSGMSQSEISLYLEQPLGTVKTRVRLGMIQLKESLAPIASEQ